MKEEGSSFDDVVKPLIKWLNDNANPHSVVVVAVDGAVLYTGERSIVTDEFIKD